ncbi:MAG TPA: glycosyltransferase [Burkholderiales bacterium]|nr:glycosyltransferase [Burkholderiales bacterium]
MKILVAAPGNLHTVPMNRFVPEALASLGHEAPVVDYSPTLLEKLRRKLARRDAADVVAGRLLGAIEEHKPEIFLTLYGVNVGPRVLAELRRRRITTANWWLNDPFQWARAAKILRDYDFAFTNAKYSVDAYAAAGMKHVSFLPTACDPSVHRPLEGRPFECDLSFAGDWSPAREQMVERLQAAGIDLRVYGPWRRKLRAGSPLRARLHHGFFTPARMAEIFAASRATLNVHTWRDRFDYGLNPRVFEAGACGAPQLVDHKRELDEIFGAGERAGMLVYRTDDELMQAARSLRSRAGELRAAALAAAPAFQRDHSYAARARQMLRVIDGRGERI